MFRWLTRTPDGVRVRHEVGHVLLHRLRLDRIALSARQLHQHHGFRDRPPRRDVQPRLPVDERPAALDRGVAVSGHGVVHDAEDDPAVDGEADGGADERVGVDKVHGAVDGVDDPGGAVGELGDGGAVGGLDDGLLADEGVVGELGGEAGGDELLHGAVGLRQDGRGVALVGLLGLENV